MRLGGHFFRANTTEELQPLCETLDRLGLSALPAPPGYEAWTDEECVRFGEKARELGLVVGEAGYFGANLLDPDPEAGTRHIEAVRTMLVKGDLMGLRGVVTLVGTKHPNNHPLCAHPDNFGEAIRAEYREVCLRIVDGLDLKTCRYMTEPWCNTFYYQPEDIHAFLQSVGDPRVGLHLDMMNMVSQTTYFHTTALIERTFDMLSEHVVSVHAKDIHWDHRHLMLKLDEVPVGEGVMDYDTFLRRLNELDPDLPVYTEHWRGEEQWVHGVECLLRAAEKAGTPFLRRGEGA